MGIEFLWAKEREKKDKEASCPNKSKNVSCSVFDICSEHVKNLISQTSAYFNFLSLLSKGYSLDAIATATLEANKINQQRISSASSQNWDKINEVSERFSRMFKKSGMGSKQQVVAHSA